MAQGATGALQVTKPAYAAENVARGKRTESRATFRGPASESERAPALPPALLAVLDQELEVRRGPLMAALGAPAPGRLGAVEVADLVEEHAEVEGGIGDAGLLGPQVRASGALKVAPLLQQQAEIGCGAAVSALGGEPP